MDFSIMFDKEKCKGCTNCMKRCPTQSIRLKNGKAAINHKKCIHCGECIKICPYNAYSPEYIETHKYKNYKCKIAIPSTTIYGQFPKGTEICKIQNSFLKIGFDFVYDESWASELVSKAIKKKIDSSKDQRPLISTNCPSVVRLIKIRYPSLMEHLISLEDPMEISAKLARNRAKKLLQLDDNDIGVFYVSPCPAKILAVTEPIGIHKPSIDWVVPLNTIYGDLYKEVKKETGYCYSNPSLQGIKWAVTGGQSESAGLTNYIAVNGMENIIDILDEIENGKADDVDFVELLACVNGCVGGTFTIENPFIAGKNIEYIINNTKKDNLLNSDLEKFDEFFEQGIFDLSMEGESHSVKVNMSEAVARMDKIKEIVSKLPGLDCGSCGAPNCYSLAEDIYDNNADLKSCVILRVDTER
jgi:iron only hydrogenase large subunit-like protein